MTEKIYKDPLEYQLPEGFRHLKEDEKLDLQNPEIKKSLRYFAKQVHDLDASAFIKERDTEEDIHFLNICRRDSKKFRRALGAAFARYSEKNDVPDSTRSLFSDIFVSNKAINFDEKTFHMSVEIRPLFFSSALDDDEKAEVPRYPLAEGNFVSKYTVFLHLDKEHHFQMKRFSAPDAHSVLESVMSQLLGPFSTEEFQELLETRYGDWDYLADFIVKSLVGDLKNMRSW
jgi:hypothetical protein